MVYEMKPPGKLAPLFENWQETLIWSCLDGSMGRAFATDCENPESARIITADFSFFAGKADYELAALHIPGLTDRFMILVPEHPEWERTIEMTYGFKAKKIVRYATKKEGDTFDRNRLKELAGRLPSKAHEAYALTAIHEGIYREIMSLDWSRDLCSQFRNYDDYRNRGLGFAVLFNGRIVAGASSYTVYQGGIEIEVDTRSDFRGRGLASACGARLILECLDRGLYPSWDAHTSVSLSLAQKLGYRFDREYTAYEAAGTEA